MTDATGRATQAALTMLFSAVFEGDNFRIEEALKQLDFVTTLAELASEWGAAKLGAIAIDNELALANPEARRVFDQLKVVSVGPGALEMAKSL